MTDFPSQISVHETDGVTIYSPLETIVTSQDFETFRAAFRALLEQRPNCRVLVNMERVQHVNSAMNALFIGMQMKARNAGAILKFCRVNPGVAESFRITNLDRLLEIYPTEAEALNSF